MAGLLRFDGLMRRQGPLGRYQADCGSVAS